jgi:hypothetical protein
MNDVQLTGEDAKLFEEFYQQRLADAGGARDDAEELEIAREILRAVVNDGLTPTPDGGESYVRRQGALDWTDPATVQAAAQVSAGRKARLPAAGGGKAPLRGQANLKDIATGIAMVVVAVGAAVWFFVPKEGAGKATETPAAEALAADATPTPLPTLEADLLADIVDASGVRTDLVVPRTLDIRGVSFVVQPVKIGAGDWPPPDDERAVSWVYGSVVNYVMGVEATPENKTLLAGLRTGDELLLRMSTGSAYRFAFADAVRVAPQAAEVFRQTRPGLTLALLGEEDQASRVVIRAVYVPDSELAGGGVGDVSQAIEPGQPVVLPAPVGAAQVDGALRLAYLAATPAAPPGTPPGYVYLAVDYAVENILAEGRPLATTNFVHQVVDAGGLSYPATTAAGSLAVRHPPLPVQLEAGRVATATAVYAVPEEALVAGLAWRFTPAPGGTTVQAAIPPYTGLLGAQVAAREATRLPDGSLAVIFTISAPQLRDVQITPADVEVRGGRLAEGDSFPWQVPAGDSADFRLSLAPDGPAPYRGQAMTVSLLGHGFEVIEE